MEEVKQIYFPTKEKWREWLEENHVKESRVAVIRYKKETGKPSPSYEELLHEAICFGWIDSTIQKIDDARYITNFLKRTGKSRWSKNSLRYARGLIKRKKMSAQGMAYYLAGLKKGAYDAGIPKHPKAPRYLKKVLNKNKTAKKNFSKFTSSHKKTLLRWLLKAKLPKTRDKRIKKIMKIAKEKNKK